MSPHVTPVLRGDRDLLWFMKEDVGTCASAWRCHSLLRYREGTRDFVSLGTSGYKAPKLTVRNRDGSGGKILFFPGREPNTLWVISYEPRDFKLDVCRTIFQLISMANRRLFQEFAGNARHTSRQAWSDLIMTNRYTWYNGALKAGELHGHGDDFVFFEGHPRLETLSNERRL